MIQLTLLPMQNSFPKKSSLLSHSANSSGISYTGNILICKTLALEYPTTRLWTNELSDTLEFILLEFMDKVYGTDKATVTDALEQIDSTMMFCLHPLAFEFTVGDFLLWGAIKGNPQILQMFCQENIVRLKGGTNSTWKHYLILQKSLTMSKNFLLYILSYLFFQH